MATKTLTTNRRAELLEHAKEHMAADMLVRGLYADGDADSFKGCSVGCFLHSIYPRKRASTIANLDNKHAIVAKHYGYPEWLALLQDTIFEGLPNGDSAKWHVQLAEKIAALPVDVNWQPILHRAHIGLLRIAYRTAGSAQSAVQTVIDLHERAAKGEDVSNELWRAAESAAWSARSAAWSARSAAWSARSAAESARSAAWSARSAAESARSAAWSARSAAESAAWSAAYQDMRDAVLEALAA